jgi:flagellar biosynthesis/type III secretory pathway M-ring protein FliF/YscJ
MIRLVMERSDLTLWPILSFILFLVSCALMLLWMYRPGSATFYGNLSRMALGDAKDDGVGQNENARQGKE